MASLNRCKFATSTTGTGAITVGSASSGFQTPSAAGAVDGLQYGYVIEDGTAWEVGEGVFSSSATILTRTTVRESSNSDAAINLSGSAAVYVTPTADTVIEGGLAPLSIPYFERSGIYLTALAGINSNPAYSATAFANVIFYSPVTIPETRTYTQIACRVITAAAAGKFLRMGIFENVPGKNQPGKVLLDSGSIAADTTGHKTFAFSQSLRAGRKLWLALVSDGAPVMAGLEVLPTNGMGLDVGSGQRGGLSEDRAYAAFTDETAILLDHSGTGNLVQVAVGIR